MNNVQENDVSQTANSTKIYKFLIELMDHDNKAMPIWRTLEIPERYSFYDLHVAIQDSLIWSDVELHKFDMKNPKTMEMEYIGIEDDLMSDPIVFEKEALIANYFTLSNCCCIYMYNFVRPWTFCVTLKKILPAIPNIKYPRCVDGKGLVPEIRDADNINWNDLQFNLKSIEFRDPEEAWLDAFQGF